MRERERLEVKWAESYMITIKETGEFGHGKEKGKGEELQ